MSLGFTRAAGCYFEIDIAVACANEDLSLRDRSTASRIVPRSSASAGSGSPGVRRVEQHPRHVVEVIGTASRADAARWVKSGCWEVLVEQVQVEQVELVKQEEQVGQLAGGACG